jgi:hypothetical protein
MRDFFPPHTVRFGNYNTRNQCFPPAAAIRILTSRAHSPGTKPINPEANSDDFLYWGVALSPWPFAKGHGFSRAANRCNNERLQPLGLVEKVPHPFFPPPPQGLKPVKDGGGSRVRHE